MPLITLNLKPPSGLSFHYDLITQQVTQSLLDPPSNSNTDLVLIPISGDQLVCHQSVLAPVSTFLTTLFREFTCVKDCASKQIVQIYLDLDLCIVRNILNLVYTGTAALGSQEELVLLKGGLKVLGIDIKLTKEYQGYQGASKTVKAGKRSFSNQQMKKASAKRPKVTDDAVTMFKCEKCDANFQFRKGLATHNKKHHQSGSNDLNLKQGKQIEITSFFSLHQQQSKQVVIENPKYATYCGICSKIFPLTSLLFQHLASIHYPDKIMNFYPEEICPFPGCDHVAKYFSNKTKHVAESHPNTINVLLQKSGQSPIQTCPADNFLATLTSQSSVFQTPQCQLCSYTTRVPSALAVHYMTTHYPDHTNSWSTSNCQLCLALLSNGSSNSQVRLLQHVALRHTALLVALMERDKLWVGRQEVFLEGEHGYVNNKAVRVDLVKRNDPYFLKLVKMINKSPIKRYINATYEEVPSDYVKIEVDPLDNNINPNIECFLCTNEFTEGGITNLLEHMSSTHYRQEIERTYMTRPDSMWATSKQCPFCSVTVQDWELFIHHVGVEHRAVEQFLPLEYRPQTEEGETKTESSHICPMPGCSRCFPSERSLQVHLVMSHYYKQMEVMVEEMFSESGSKCPKCNKILPSSRVGYMKHLGVDHGVVMDLVRGKVSDVRNIKKE